MKFLIVLLMLIVHARCSIFGEFRDVVSSLENSFEKMISDVVTDVRQTIDCTVEAVESALSMRSTAINPRCKGAVKEYQEKNDKRNNLSLMLPDTLFSDTHNGHDFTSYKQNEMLNKNEFENIQDIKNRLAIDDDRLNDIKAFLKAELEKMSASMKIKFKELEYDQKSALDAVIKYLNILHDLKRNSKSDSEINEAHRILDGASKILNLNVKNNDSDDVKVKRLLSTLEQNSNIDKIDRQKTISKLTENNSNNKHNNSESSSSFKDIFNKAISTTVTKDKKEENNKKIEEVKRELLNGISLTGDNIENNVESLFDSGPNSKEALNEATKIFQDSKRTNSILNNFFSNAAQAGSSIFDNPESS